MNVCKLHFNRQENIDQILLKNFMVIAPPHMKIQSEATVKRGSTSFCSKQCEHQKAPYSFAPIECRCLAREIAKGLDFVLTSVVKYGISVSLNLLKIW